MLNAKQTVLIVDDEASLLSSSSTALTMLGYNTESANNGKKAIDIIQNNHIDFIVMDKNMPDLDGFAVLQKLNELELVDDIIVIIVSGYLTPEEDDEFKAIGAYSCLQKPYSIHVLVDLLKKATADKNQ